MNLRVIFSILPLLPTSVFSGPYALGLVGPSEDVRLISLDSYPSPTETPKDRLSLEIAPWASHGQSLRHLRIMHRRLFGGEDENQNDCLHDKERTCICNCTCNESSNRKLRVLFGGDTPPDSAGNHSIADDDGSTNYCTDDNETEDDDSSNRSLRIMFVADDTTTTSSDDNNATEADYCTGQSNQTSRFLFGGDGDHEAAKIGDCSCSSEASGGFRMLFGGDDTVNDDDCSRTATSAAENPYDKYDFDVPTRIPIYTASLSLFGSIWIIIEVLRDGKKRKLAYHRFVFALSCFDVTLSICYLITPLTTADDFFRDDSTERCQVAGFFTYWASLCIPAYNAILGIYFLLKVKFGWQEHRIQKNFERYVHALVPTVTMLLSIPPLKMNLYNSYYNYCFITYAGEGRGTVEQSDIFQGIFFAMVAVSTSALTICMALLTWTIRSTIWKGRHWSLHASNQNKLLGRVHTMLFLYTIPFYLTWVIPTVWQIIVKIYWLDMVAGKKRFEISALTTYVMQVWVATFLPLQGFFNWVIYMRSRFHFLQDIGVSCQLIMVNIFTRMCCKGRGNSTDNDCDNENNTDDDESMIGSWVRSMEEELLTSTEEMVPSQELVRIDREQCEEVLSA